MEALVMDGGSLATKALALLLSELPGKMQVTELSDPDEVLKRLRGPGRQVIVVMLGASPHILETLDRQLPRAKRQPGVLVLVPDGTPAGRLFPYLRAGWGFVYCGSSEAALLAGLNAVAAGGWYAEPRMAYAFVSAFTS